MLSLERQEWILKMLAQKGHISISELCRELRISAMTAGRDLQRAVKEGYATRVRGGAVGTWKSKYEESYTAKQSDFMTEKAKIGRTAARLVADGDTVILDAGTTTLWVARHLEGLKGLTVITNALHIANELSGNPDISLVLIGGQQRATSHSLVGPLAVQCFKTLYADEVFLGTEGISEAKGFTVPDMLEADVKVAMVSAARKVFVVADHSKFNTIRLISFAHLGAAAKIISDAMPSDELRQACSRERVEIVLAQDA